MKTRLQRQTGIIILEVLLALALAGSVGVALTVGLRGLAENTLAARREIVIMRNLESLLTEASKAQEYEEGVVALGEDQALGQDDLIYYERIIEPMEEIENADGQLLQNMWRIAIRAEWEERGEIVEEIAETWRYLPLYQPNQ